MNYLMTVRISTETREQLRVLAERQGTKGFPVTASAKLAAELLAKAVQREIDAQE